MCRLADYKERRLLISPKVLLSLQLKCIKSKLKQLGISHDALLTTSVGLGCANYTSADVIGALFAKVETKSNDGKKKVGKALVYVLKTGGNLLSCSTLKKLGLLPAGWPNKVTSGDTIYELNEVLKEGAVPIHAGGPSDITRKPLGQCDPDSALPCSCPRRQFTDPPDVLPMPATTVNRSKLEECFQCMQKTTHAKDCRTCHEHLYTTWSCPSGAITISSHWRLRETKSFEIILARDLVSLYNGFPGYEDMSVNEPGHGHRDRVA
jgi:hypothetical protein